MYEGNADLDDIYDLLSEINSKLPAAAIPEARSGKTLAEWEESFARLALEHQTLRGIVHELVARWGGGSDIGFSMDALQKYLAKGESNDGSD